MPAAEQTLEEVEQKSEAELSDRLVPVSVKSCKPVVEDGGSMKQ